MLIISPSTPVNMKILTTLPISQNWKEKARTASYAYLQVQTQFDILYRLYIVWAIQIDVGEDALLTT